MPTLHSVAGAQAAILQHVQPLAATSLPLTSSLLGCVLAEDICSDLDSPPFDKALMDGYAVPTGQLMPEGLSGYDPAIPVDPYDPDHAGKLLAVRHSRQFLALFRSLRQQPGPLLDVLLDKDPQRSKLRGPLVLHFHDIQSVRSGDALREGTNLVEVQGHSRFSKRI